MPGLMPPTLKHACQKQTICNPNPHPVPTSSTGGRQSRGVCEVVQAKSGNKREMQVGVGVSSSSPRQVVVWWW